MPRPPAAPGARQAVLRVVVFDDLLAEGDFGADLPPDVHLRVLDRADQAVAVVGEETPDLVLMDFEMNSSVTGERAVTELRRHHPRGTLAIYAISASEEYNRRMVAAGADQVVAKGGISTFLEERADAARRRRATTKSGRSRRER